jgi:hypothetical protein
LNGGRQRSGIEDSDEDAARCCLNSVHARRKQSASEILSAIQSMVACLDFLTVLL